jgi:hypothetical protein
MQFGASISLSKKGNMLAIGAPQFNVGVGATFVYA